MYLIEDFDLIENNSRKYVNGSKWNTRNHGIIEVVGKSNKYYIDNTGKKTYRYYLIKFKDGTLIETSASSLTTGKISNPNEKSIFKIGSVWNSNNYGEFKIIGFGSQYDKRIIEFSDGYSYETRTSQIRKGEVRNKNDTLNKTYYIGEHKVFENKSDIYYNGSEWNTKNHGSLEILGRIDSNNFLCRFQDGTIITSDVSAIKDGRVKNPNTKNIFGVACFGVGEFKAFSNNKSTKEYRIWFGMISRCYNKKIKGYKSYGGKGVYISNEWLNFQNFCKDIKDLNGYDKWLNCKDREWHLDKDIICDELKIYPKFYSKQTCHFVPQEINLKHKRRILTKNIDKLTNI